MTFRHWAATLALLLLAAGAAFLASGNALGGPATPPAALQETVLPPPRPQAQGRLPRVAIVAHNSNTELTDFVVPYGILQRSGAAEVWALGVEPSPIQLFPPSASSPMPASTRSMRATRTAPTTSSSRPFMRTAIPACWPGCSRNGARARP